MQCHAAVQHSFRRLLLMPSREIIRNTQRPGASAIRSAVFFIRIFHVMTTSRSRVNENDPAVGIARYTQICICISRRRQHRTAIDGAGSRYCLVCRRLPRPQHRPAAGAERGTSLLRSTEGRVPRNDTPLEGCLGRDTPRHRPGKSDYQIHRGRT